MTRQRAGFFIGLLVLCVSHSAKANVVYTESLNLNHTVSNFLGFIGGGFNYAHSNPFESVGGFSSGQYSAAVSAGLIHSIALTLDFAGINGLEWVQVQVKTNGSGWTGIGNINDNSAHTFSLMNSSFGFGASDLLGGLPIHIRILGFGGWIGGSATLETSALSLGVAPNQTAAIVPIPGAVVLAACGLGSLLCVRGRRK